MSDTTVYLNNHATEEEQWVSKKEATRLLKLSPSTIDKLWMNTPDQFWKYARSEKGQKLKLVLKTYVLEKKGDTKVDPDLKPQDTQKDNPFDNPAVQKVIEEKDSRIKDLQDQLMNNNTLLQREQMLRQQQQDKIIPMLAGKYVQKEKNFWNIF